MGRRYSVTFENVAVAAAQDLFEINGAAGKMLRIIGIKWGATNTTLPTAQMLSTRARFLPATVTSGTGGAAVTPQPYDPGDAAASFTAERNNTTPATTSGTAKILHEAGNHVYAGEDYMFPTPPVIGPSESFVYELLSTPAGTLNLSGKIEVEEIGG
jgi:hypothetical protein